MNRRTTIGIAGGVTLIIAAAAAAVGVNLGIMSGADTRSGPGNFEPVALEQSAPDITTATTPPTVAVTTEPTTPATTPADASSLPFGGTDRDDPEDGVRRTDEGTVYLDDDHDDDHGGDRDHDRGIDDDSSSGHGSGSDDDD